MMKILTLVRKKKRSVYILVSNNIALSKID